MSKQNQGKTKESVILSPNFIKKKGFRTICLTTVWGCLWYGLTAVKALAGIPNGTWLSQPQIRYHSSTNTLSHVMQDIYRQRYRVVFLDYRGVSDELQQRVSQEARAQNLIPVVWIQSPQYRSLTVEQLIYEARHGDAIQIDDHFFTHYSARQFQYLSYQYEKPIFCSIQPFQAKAVSRGRCNQIDVQCYTTNNFRNCLALADRLNAVVSLFDKQTFRYRTKLGTRQFNVFLWPYSHRRWHSQELLPTEEQNTFSSVLSNLVNPMRERTASFNPIFADQKIQKYGSSNYD